MLKRVATSSIHFAQARRLVCAHCTQPTIYVWGGVASDSEKQSAVIADDAELSTVSFQNAANALDKLASSPNQGRGRCAHCHRLQPWMVVTPVMAGLLTLGIGLALTGAAVFLSWIVTSEFMALQQVSQASTAAAIAGIGAFVSLVVALIAAPRMADDPGPAHHADPHAKTDDDFQAWLARCASDGTDPFLSWWAMVDARPAKGMPFSMGLFDLTNAPLTVDPALTHEARSAALNGM